MSKSEMVRLEIEGAELAVRVAGDPEKPALLLIHGFPGPSESFRNVIGTLARDCFVIAPDLPGFGGSRPVERPSFSHFADLLDGLLARLGAGSFHLYLHDYGAPERTDLLQKRRIYPFDAYLRQPEERLC